MLPHTSLDSPKSPYELLHGQTPEYQALRVFGCACYPMLRDYAQHKFDPSSLKCVFLGYNDKYKGYRCLLPTTGRFYISRHVVFDEQSFPFSDIYLSSPARINYHAFDNCLATKFSAQNYKSCSCFRYNLSFAIYCHSGIVSCTYSDITIYSDTNTTHSIWFTSCSNHSFLFLTLILLFYYKL